MQMEKLGIPGFLFVSSNFLPDAKSAASDYAMPGMRMVVLPSEKWYRYRRSVEEGSRDVRPLPLTGGQASTLPVDERVQIITAIIIEFNFRNSIRII